MHHKSAASFGLRAFGLIDWCGSSVAPARSRSSRSAMSKAARASARWLPVFQHVGLGRWRGDAGAIAAAEGDMCKVQADVHRQPRSAWSGVTVAGVYSAVGEVAVVGQ